MENFFFQSALTALGGVWVVVGTLLQMTKYLNDTRDRIIKDEKAVSKEHFRLLLLDWKSATVFVILLCLAEAFILGWLSYLSFPSNGSGIFWLVLAAIAMIPFFMAVCWGLGGWQDLKHLRDLEKAGRA